MDLSATPLKAFWKVIVPYLMPAIVSGALMSFTLSLDEYIVSVFTTGAQSQTLPLEALVKEKLLRPLDKKAIPNLKHIDPKFLNMPFDPGNKYSVPFMAGTVGIVVNTDLVKDDIKSFSDVFKPANKGKIVALDDAREIVSWALLSKGIPVNDVSDKNLEKAKGVLSDWIPLIKVYDSDSPKTALLNGDVAIGVVWGGEGAILLNENKKFQWVIPAEGTHLFIDSVAAGAEFHNLARGTRLSIGWTIMP